MKHVVSLSGGLSSAVATNRVVDRYGCDNVILWFADTLWEDEDLYRFLDDLERRFSIPIIRHKNTMNPLEIAEDQHMIPNSRVAACSYRLKIRPFKAFLATLEKPLTVHIGLDWTELHRMAAPEAEYGSVAGVSVDFPLLWTPFEEKEYVEIVSDWGIRIPRLYGMGFPHNNCGGRCVRQGMSEWRRLLETFPDRYHEVMEWEERQRDNLDNRALHTINKTRIGGKAGPITLREIKDKHVGVQEEGPVVDKFGCFCSY